MFRSLTEAEAGPGPGSAIRDGDEVIVYQSHREGMRALVVDAGKRFACKFGTYDMRTWVGQPFGSRVLASDRKGFLFLLAPTPELWTQALRHRTQILYAADIALITAFLELWPGAVVLESGTGSGSLTHALARAVAPNGRVHTFEFHAERAAEADREFTQHGLGPLVSLQQRDIEARGFPSELAGAADAVFLDLPAPWKVVESAAACLREDGVFCAFSPCIEQVQRTAGALARAGFHGVRTMECLLREQEVRSAALETDVLSPQAPGGAGQKRKRDRAPHANAAGDEIVLVRPQADARGHTGYLTFARRIVRQAGPGAEAEPVPEPEPVGDAAASS